LSARRDFLVRSTGLTLAILAGGLVRATRGLAAQPESRAVSAWVTIAADDSVTIKVASMEMGQGVSTSLPLIVAEEMDADWSKVSVESVANDAKTYGNPKIFGLLYTAGSTAVEGYFDILRQAGATARRVLIHTAARSWGVPIAEVASESGFIVHKLSGRRASFGRVAMLPDVVTDVPAPAESDLKSPKTYRLIGKVDERRDVPAKTRGAEIYSIDVRLPGMAYGAVRRAPVEGERPLKVDDASATAMQGVIAVIAVPEGVAVVAERWEIAVAARAALKIEWSRESPFRTADSETDLRRDLAAVGDPARQGIVWTEHGDARAAFASGARIVEAEYTTDHAYHAQLEPLAAVAAVEADGKGAEVWVGTQAQSIALGVAAGVLGTSQDRIRLHPMQMGGGFGRRTMFTRELLRDALLLSRQVKRPVKLLWTREDDVKNGWFRPATAQRMTAALDTAGNVIAWRHRVACPSISGYYNPELLARAKNRDLLVMEGSELSEYQVPNVLTEHVITERRARIAAWRGIGPGHNAFAAESFVDEIARSAGLGPVAFRRRLLGANARAAAVLGKVVAMSRFGRAPRGRAHGLSLAPYKKSLAAGVAEISLENGAIRVHRFWAAVDAGLSIQPRNLIAQVEGGVVFGLSGLLHERIVIRQGEVQQCNFDDYPVMRGSHIPEIEVQIVRSDAPPSGAGELGVPMTSASVANAFFALTGKRIRQLPLTPDRVRAALS
jgi:isoquinoline 1-oxidoreductase subunit beta